MKFNPFDGYDHKGQLYIFLPLLRGYIDGKVQPVDFRSIGSRWGTYGEETPKVFPSS